MELNNNTAYPYCLAQETESDVINHDYGKRVQDITSSSPTPEKIANRISTDDACRERLESDRKKCYKRWTEDEHRRFLKGLQDHGNKWTLISHEYVVTKNPTQVASHAQKYFGRQEKSTGGNESRKRRPSIHDITIETVESKKMKSSHHMPAPTPHRNQTIAVGIPKVQQAGWISNHNGNASKNLNWVESLDSTSHVARIGFNPNGHNVSDTSCYRSHLLARQHMSQQEIENWVGNYNDQEWMGFNSNADSTFEQSSFGFSTDDAFDLQLFAEHMPEQELEYSVDHYNEQVRMGLNSNADNKWEVSSFGFSNDDPVDLLPFPGDMSQQGLYSVVHYNEPVWNPNADNMLESSSFGTSSGVGNAEAPPPTTASPLAAPSHAAAPPATAHVPIAKRPHKLPTIRPSAPTASRSSPPLEAVLKETIEGASSGTTSRLANLMRFVPTPGFMPPRKKN